ncbi:hypothetical protein [Saccharopolyspora gregorii]|uniref:Secreted protein n=1 Tax=Saccharopolyspora gregorii TaxID=33914 RepID=A0ABP6RZA1_9PSEU
MRFGKALATAALCVAGAGVSLLGTGAASAGPEQLETLPTVYPTGDACLDKVKQMKNDPNTPDDYYAIYCKPVHESDPEGPSQVEVQHGPWVD